MKKRMAWKKTFGIGILVLITAFTAYQFWDMYRKGSFIPGNSAGLMEMQKKSRDAKPAYAVPGVYIEEIQSTRPITGISTDIAAFAGITETVPSGNEPVLINSFSEYQDIFGGYLPESYGQYRYLPYAVKGFFANGGTRCYIVSVTPEDSSNITAEDYLGSDRQPGIQSLENLDDIGIVAVPGVQDATVQQYLIDHCEIMGDRFAILDMPENADDSRELREHRDRFDTSYAAFYHPWLQINDPLMGGSTYIPPSGAVAGIYAANDRSRGIHKAPANKPVTDITGLKYNITQNVQEDLNPYGINVIRNFPGRGYLVWGARTCSSDPEFKYVNTSRYLRYLEKSIRKGTEWLAFEPNDENTWALTKQSAENFLYNEWQKGALLGRTPNEAYFVQMDRRTMTADDIAQGKKNILIGAAVTKPAEFIVFSICQQ